GDRGEVGLEDGAEPLGIEPLAELGGADDVREEDGYELAFFRCPLDRPQRRSTPRAELESLGVLPAAIRAGHHGRSLRPPKRRLEPWRELREDRGRAVPRDR